uniref:Dirigent protein n=1 Tax=Aegilops tauschii subsp. strangulata TaxID=200361 RepID=A0A453T7T2_AEGTS
TSHRSLIQSMAAAWCPSFPTLCVVVVVVVVLIGGGGAASAADEEGLIHLHFYFHEVNAGTPNATVLNVASMAQELVDVRGPERVRQRAAGGAGPGVAARGQGAGPGAPRVAGQVRRAHGHHLLLLRLRRVQRQHAGDAGPHRGVWPGGAEHRRRHGQASFRARVHGQQPPQLHGHLHRGRLRHVFHPGSLTRTRAERV